MPKLTSIARKLESYEPNARFADDAYILVAVREALSAAEEGNFGVGAVLVSGDGAIIAQARNQVFVPTFRSDAHAEMQAISLFEASPADLNANELTLYTSVECCPMCFARLVTSRVGSVRYAAEDDNAGIVRRRETLPSVWVDLAQDQDWQLAHCSPKLRTIAEDIFISSVGQLDLRLKNEQGLGGGR